jgi:hypothetical protein
MASFRSIPPCSRYAQEASRKVEQIMSTTTAEIFEKRELMEKLKFELAFAEDGGYGRSVRTPNKPTSAFQDSPTCLNFGDPSRTHPCAECILMQYVPESRKGEDVPCHHIPLDRESRTIATLDATESQDALKGWLRHEIGRLEGELVV